MRKDLPENPKMAMNTGCTVRMCTKSLQCDDGAMGMYTKGIPVFYSASGDISR